MELNENGQPRSIWDGWEKQIYFRAADGNGGFCARGFTAGQCFEAVDETEARVGRYIQQHYELPQTHELWFDGFELKPCTKPVHAIVYANDSLKLTPDDFRRIDRETQMEEMARTLVESAEGTEVPKFIESTPVEVAQ